MARIPEIERRLLNWARCRLGPSIGTSGTTRVDGEGWDAPTVIPNNEADAAETERAVQSLESSQRTAVIDVYTGSGDIRSKAKKAGISVATLYSRVDAAHKCLDRWFRDQHQAAEAERVRVEKLQLTAAEIATREPHQAAPPRNFGSRIAEWLAERRAEGF